MSVPGSAEDRIVVGYFSDGAQAYRAINELIDEGFNGSDVGAAFRTPRTATGPRAAGMHSADTDSGEMKSVRDLTETNPAVSGSVGGAGSHDQAVTPAGLAPGSGNAFPGAPTSPGPIPGSEIPSGLPSTLKHDLPQTLPHDIPSTSVATSGTTGTTTRGGERWMGRLHERYSGEPADRKSSASSQKFGTGEGHLDLVAPHEYSSSAFEGSFQGMGLDAEQARSLSGELGRGGAVVTVHAGERASLAEGIIERNHGRVRLETSAAANREADRESSVEVYGSMCDWYPGEHAQRRAS